MTQEPPAGDPREIVATLSVDERVSLLSGSDVWRTQPLPSIGLPAVMMTDGPHGLRKQEVGGDHLGASGSNPATCFPTAVTLASSWDEDLLAEVGAALGREARAEGVALVLGPGLNIKRHPNCGRNFEYLSEDPLLSGRLAAALVRGIQSQGVGACLKHFAVNNQEAHRLVVDAVVDERTLREIYLAGFETAVRESHPWAVMAAYNSVNGTFCTDNWRLLTQILRREWNFTGLVVSDWGATNDRVAGVRAGMDLEMPSSGGVFDADVTTAIERGDLGLQDLDACAARVVELVQRAPARSGPPADLDAHHELARRAAAESAVLLANDGLLPLDPGRSVAVIGAFAREPRYQGFGSSLVNPTRLDDALGAITARVADGTAVHYSPGYDPIASAPDSAALAEAEATARKADVAVLMVGLPGVYESEGFDRTDMHLPAQHEQLIRTVCRANPRTVVVLSNGSPVAMPWADEPAAILEAYLAGQAGGSALADVLYGDREPGGRLAESFPMVQSDVPSDPWFPGRTRQVEYREGVFVGYRYFTTAGVPVRFPFGHGLGYTQFEYDDPEIPESLTAGDNLIVRVRVTNAGTRPGADVVQVYLHDGTGAVPRPELELAGFAKVLLHPGQSEVVDITVPGRAFAHYDVAAGGWRTGDGEYRVDIGASSADIRLSATVTVTDGIQPSDGPPVVPGSGADLLGASDAEFAARLGRPIPEPPPTRPFSRLTTVGELRATRLGSLIRTGLHRYTRGQFEEMTDHDQGMVAKLAEALDEMPLRGIVLFADGRVSLAMLDRLVDMLNGQVVQGSVATVRALPGAAVRGLRSLIGG